MIASSRQLTAPFLLVACSMSLLATGCVGPMACGPNGSSGPLGLHSCDGCGECEGCGELYLDPWLNSPPSCDPCDCCGNYNGQSCGRCRPVFGGLASLWGYRCDKGAPPCTRCGVATCGGCDGGACELGACDAGACDAGACEATCGCGVADCDASCGVDACDGACGGCNACTASHSAGALESFGAPITRGPQIASQPTPAQVTRVRPAEESYKPQPERKIFRSRPSIAQGPPKASDY